MLSLQTAVCWGRAGMPKAALKILMELKKSQGGRPIRVAGRNVAMFTEDGKALKWLAGVLGSQRGFAGIGKEQWVMFRGNAARTAFSSPASPVWDARWTVDTVIDHDTENRTAVTSVSDKIKAFEQTRRKNGLLMQPAGHPLIVGDLAIFRTLERVWAVNVRTGGVAWKGVMPDRTYRHLAGIENDPSRVRTVRRSYSPTTNNNLTRAADAS